MASCTQCGKPAIVSVGKNPLCIDCWLKFQQAAQIQDNILRQGMNDCIDNMEAITGMYGVLPRHNIPQPIVHQGSLTFHNIKVDQSVVGSINTGEVQRISVAMSHIKTSGNEKLITALKEFTEAVINKTQLDAELKNQILELISFLASQSALPKEKQKSGIVKVVLLGIKEMVSAVALLSPLWEKLQPLLEQVFS